MKKYNELLSDLGYQRPAGKWMPKWVAIVVLWAMAWAAIVGIVVWAVNR